MKLSAVVCNIKVCKQEFLSQGTTVQFNRSSQTYMTRSDLGKIWIVKNKWKKWISEGISRLVRFRKPILIPFFFFVLRFYFYYFWSSNEHCLFVYRTSHYPWRKNQHRSKSHMFLPWGHSHKQWCWENFISCSVSSFSCSLLLCEP